ncbi:MAG: hypothetical protein WDZ40_02305 [Candidatus Spechtbacterales bacterium]
MDNIKLNKEEKKILEDFDKEELKRVRGIEKEKERYGKYAKNTLGKSKSINIRLSERDLQKLKAIAVEKGMPYQTLISSLLHQYSSKKKKDKVL